MQQEKIYTEKVVSMGEITEILDIKEMLRRMQQLTRDARIMQVAIARYVFRAEQRAGDNSLRRASGGAITINELRAAVDDLRQVLWLYEGTHAAVPADDARKRLLSRATEILSALSLHPPLPTPYEAETTDSLSRLLRLIECTDGGTSRKL